MPGIGTLTESHLHAVLKEREGAMSAHRSQVPLGSFAPPGDACPIVEGDRAT